MCGRMEHSEKRSRPLSAQLLSRHGWRIHAREVRVRKPVSLLFLIALPAVAQVNYGELRLKIADPSGAGVQAVVDLTCAGNGYGHAFTSSTSGMLEVQSVPYGRYRLQITKPGFAPFAASVEVRSPLPVAENIQLSLASVTTKVNVTGTGTLIDPDSPSSVMQIGEKQIQERLSSLPGRSVQDLINSQPGWLYEGNAVLHPRGSEYQTQFVIDGIPLTDNRSPSFGPEVEADGLDAVSIYTAGYPAEYGRKMGGIVELDTRRQTDPGVHGQLVLSGGNYETASSYGRVQDVWGRNTVSATASGSTTNHYLNPVVPENFTNTGTVADFSTRYERDLTAKDRLSFDVRHELARFLIPNELLQEQAGQIQNGDNFETMGTVHYQHIVSPYSLIALAGMVRDNASDLYSNPKSTPIIAFQHNSFREGYFNGSVSFHRGRHQFKVGIESDAIFLHEHFNYEITNPAYFDGDTPPSLSFTDQRPDLEQSAFAEDLIRLGNWTVSAGLRWDHYQLLLNQNAFSPRISLGRYLPSLDMVLHASFDRVFQTPSFENILISSSPQIDTLSDQFLRLAVQPSRGNYYEAGLSQALLNRTRIDLNLYRRDVRNFADDDQLLNTGVSYPIAFDKSVIYGAEGKLSVVRLGRLSGYLSYSYMVGTVWFPVTGGLFLGQGVANAISQLHGHLPNSQDQRNTIRTRFQYRLAPRIWFAAGAEYGSGLPFQFEGTEADALAEYGTQVVSRINFARGRTRPVLAVSSSLGVDVYKGEKVNVRFQVDGENLNNRLNVIDFGGLFSGNAIGPARSGTMRLNTSF
jgi:TonB-dependent Receptor Plug Domain